MIKTISMIVSPHQRKTQFCQSVVSRISEKKSASFWYIVHTAMPALAPRPRKSPAGPHGISYFINAISGEPRRRRLILPSGLQADSNSICDRDGGRRGRDGGREQAKDNKLRFDVDLKKKKKKARKTSLGAPRGNRHQALSALL